MKRLAIVTTHPIQYYAPLFTLLTERKKIVVKVFYTWGAESRDKIYDPGFGKMRQWDIPLLNGYDYEFIENVSARPGSHHFGGINNPGLIKKIKEWMPNAILVIGWKFISHLKVMRYFKGKIPILFRGDSTLLDEPTGFSVKKLMRRLVLSYIYKYIDYALYTGTNNKAYFLLNGVKESQLFYAPHAIDNDRFSNRVTNYEEKAMEWKEELNIPPDTITVLFAGKLEPKKNPLFLVDAAIAFPQMHFIIVGNGELELMIKNKIKNIKNITWLPFQNQSQMPLVYRLADIFTLPSGGPGETWGLSINEAIASNRMVIASNKCGGAIDLIKHGENGFIINPDIKSFFEVLESIQQTKNLKSDLSFGTKEILQSFSLQNLSQKIEDTMQ